LTTPIGPPRREDRAVKPSPHQRGTRGGLPEVRSGSASRDAIPGGSSAQSVIRKGSFGRQRPTSRRSLPELLLL